MTPEEYIKSKRREDYPGGQLCYIVSEETALKAVEMAREEKENSTKLKFGDIWTARLGYVQSAEGFILRSHQCAVIVQMVTILI